MITAPIIGVKELCLKIWDYPDEAVLKIGFSGISSVDLAVLLS